MKTALIKLLKIDSERLTPKEKGEVLKKLKEEYGLSNRSLGILLNVPHSTIHDWISGRQKHIPGCLHVSMTSLIKHFEVYEPKNLNEWGMIVKLNKIIGERIKNSPINNINENIGWENEKVNN